MSFPEREQARPKVNARLYSPYLGRFISPDPLLNSEGGPLDYNPYIYARNNPYKYIDRNGEFWWLVAPAILGGFTSAFANFDCINSIGDFFANYGPSLLASGIATVAGIAVGGVVAAGCASVGIVTLAPVIAAGASGAAVYLTYNCVYSACTGTPFNFSWTDLGFDVGLAVATAGAGVIARKLAPKLSKIMQRRYNPIKTEPDAMPAIPNAEKAISPAKEYVRPETWEIHWTEETKNLISTDVNSSIIKRPEVINYNTCLKKTDAFHSFPKSFDKFVVKHGLSRTVGNSSGYVLPGFHNSDAGFFHINLNNKTGMIYHRAFYKYANRGQIYVKCGNEKVFFFK